MHAKIAYLILGALSALASATPVDTAGPAAATGSVAPAPVGPTPDPESITTAAEIDPNARAAFTVKVCTDAGFRGRCATFGSTNRVCCKFTLRDILCYLSVTATLDSGN